MNSRLFKGLASRIARLRHLRGHGVHSPYIYSIVRSVFMRRNLITPQLAGIEKRCQRSMGKRAIVELQNLYTYCGYKSYEIDPLVTPKEELSEFVICSADYPTTGIEQLYEVSKVCGTTLVIELSDDERGGVCAEIVERHPSTVVDKGRYLIIFNNHLPKQHFKL